jgi:restriction endonuclease S subunit
MTLVEIRQPLWINAEDVPRLPVGWRALPTAEACIQLKVGKLFEKKTVADKGRVPVLNQSDVGFLGYHDEEPGVTASPELPVVTFANHTCAMRLMKQPFSSIQNVFPKIGKPGITDTVYFYYATLGRVGLSDYKGHHPVFRQAFIPIPPLSIQRRIAGILSAYDELIENSQRRIKILEATARAIYLEWFVNFRFPGYESVVNDSSEHGATPKGWAIRKVSEAAEFTRGFEPGSDAYKQQPGIGLVRFLRVGDLSKRDSSLYIAEDLAQGRLLTPFDVAITLDGSVGEVRVGLMGAYSSGIRRVDVKDPARLGWAFLYQLLLSDSIQATIHAHAKGTTIKHAGSAVAALEFISPPESLIKEYEFVAAPIVHQVIQLQEQLVNLRRTRDLLLPRLISGELDVEALAA